MKKALYISLNLLVSNLVIANIGPQGFGSYGNYYFIETGTFGGAGLAKAIACGAFSEFRSIEFDQRIYADTKRRFINYNNVRLVQGNSATDLWEMIKDIDKPATFWLDAHIYPPRTDGGKNCPLMQELEQIRRHHIKTHTILIDDMNCAGTAAFDYLTDEDLINKIREINPDYQIYYVPGGDDGELPQNVLLAIVP